MAHAGAVHGVVAVAAHAVDEPDVDLGLHQGGGVGRPQGVDAPVRRAQGGQQLGRVQLGRATGGANPGGPDWMMARW